MKPIPKYVSILLALVLTACHGAVQFGLVPSGSKWASGMMLIAYLASMAGTLLGQPLPQADQKMELPEGKK